MEKTTGEIKLGNKTYKAVKVGYSSTKTSTGSIELTANKQSKTYTSTKVEGIEKTDK